MIAAAPLVRADGLSRSFTRGNRLLRRGPPLIAVQRIDLSIARGEAVGVVGESGCGKSTLGRLLLRLLPPTSGRVLFEGADLASLPGAALRRLRRRMQMVFQDPYASLDPRRVVGAQIADGLAVHRRAAPADTPDRVAALLRQVGLDAGFARRLPHEFSGGQRQRVAIARALATEPDFIVADEPVSALDVSVQAQIVNLLADLQSELALTLVFISHDLHVVRHLCDRIVVMYLGRIVEQGPTAAVFGNPVHPYTRALLAATPSMHRRERTPPLSGEVPSAANPPSGCVFRTRCPAAQARCAEAAPSLEPAPGGMTPDGATRQVACWRAAEFMA
jgi:oligopeptide/dipeptide ABC transporter ATP-binding protein